MQKVEKVSTVCISIGLIMGTSNLIEVSLLNFKVMTIVLL